MKHNIKSLATAAFVGLMAAGTLSACQTAESTDKVTQEKSSCNGKSSCSGKSSCKAKSSCKDSNSCKDANSCKK